MNKLSLMNKLELGRRIKGLRKSKGWTQKELADLASVGLTTIKEIEWGTRDPSISVIEKIADVFGTHIEIILYGNENKFEEDLESRFKQIELLNKEDRLMICKLIDSIVLKHQMQEINKPL